jgi:hypothetical protein
MPRFSQFRFFARVLGETAVACAESLNQLPTQATRFETSLVLPHWPVNVSV